MTSPPEKDSHIVPVITRRHFRLLFQFMSEKLSLLKEVDSFSVFVQTEWHNDNLQLSECKGPFGIHIHVQILKA